MQNKKGKSHLASIRIVGNKAYSRRTPVVGVGSGKIQNDVNLLSYYSKNRKAANQNVSIPFKLASGKPNWSNYAIF